MINIFEKSKLILPNDPDLLVLFKLFIIIAKTGLGLLYFMKPNFDKAVEYFKEALKYEPNNYLLWNKVGATLAH